MNQKDLLLEELENEYELRLVDVGDRPIEVLKFARREFGFTPVEAKRYLETVETMYSGLKLDKVQELKLKLCSIGAKVEVYKTGSEYLKGYDPQKIESYFSNCVEGVSSKDFYTTPIGAILFDSEGQTFFHLIEDNKLAKACKRYLIEIGQVRQA